MQIYYLGYTNYLYAVCRLLTHIYLQRSMAYHCSYEAHIIQNSTIIFHLLKLLLLRVTSNHHRSAGVRLKTRKVSTIA